MERRVGDWAVAAAGVALWLDGGVVSDVGIGLTAVGAVAVGVVAAGAVVIGLTTLDILPHADNVPSRVVAERAGFPWTGELASIRRMRPAERSAM